MERSAGDEPPVQRPREEISAEVRVIDELRTPGIPRGAGRPRVRAEVTVRTRNEVIGVTPA